MCNLSVCDCYHPSAFLSYQLNNERKAKKARLGKRAVTFDDVLHGLVLLDLRGGSVGRRGAVGPPPQIPLFTALKFGRKGLDKGVNEPLALREEASTLRGAVIIIPSWAAAVREAFGEKNVA